MTTRKRVPSAERRSSILLAARKLFAERGYEGAKTSQIAAAADVSEALVYRHFPSKLALYRAVLRQTIRDQNAMYDSLGMPQPNTESLVLVTREYLRSCIATESGALREGTRIMLASLSGDGNYAGLVYRRAMRMMFEPLGRSLAAARESGDMTGHTLAPENVAMFIDHVGTMISAGRALAEQAIPYSTNVDRLLKDATWFCCRGIGLRNEAIERHFATASDSIPKLTGMRPIKRPAQQQ